MEHPYLAEASAALRAVFGLILLGISYECYRYSNLLKNKSKTAKAAALTGLIFLVYGIARIVVAFPDISYGGFFSNVVNVILMGWLFLATRKRNDALETHTKTMSPDARVSYIIEKTIEDMRGEVPTNGK
jgi:hypothetical protein